MKRPKRILAARWMTAGVVLLGACSVNEGPTAPRGARLGRPFSISIGESVRIPGEEIEVGFRAVTADSRCPVDVVCGQWGDADMTLSLDAAAGREDFSIQARGSNERVVLGYRIRVLDLAPEPRSSAPTDPRDYRVQLVVTRS